MQRELEPELLIRIVSCGTPFVKPLPLIGNFVHNYSTEKESLRIKKLLYVVRKSGTILTLELKDTSGGRSMRESAVISLLSFQTKI